MTDELVNINFAGVVELPKMDLTKYIGQKTKIELAGTYKGTFGYYLKLETEALEVIEREGKEPIIMRASKVVGLHEDKDGNIGIGEDTKAYHLFNKYGCKVPSDFQGKEVIVQVQIGKEGKEFLSF